MHRTVVPDCVTSMAGHGGAGIILSIGLMRMLPPDGALEYILRQRGCAGGDCLLGRCACGAVGPATGCMALPAF